MVTSVIWWQIWIKLDYYYIYNLYIVCSPVIHEQQIDVRYFITMSSFTQCHVVFCTSITVLRNRHCMTLNFLMNQ